MRAGNKKNMKYDWVVTLLTIGSELFALYHCIALTIGNEWPTPRLLGASVHLWRGPGRARLTKRTNIFLPTAVRCICRSLETIPGPTPFGVGRSTR